MWKLIAATLLSFATVLEARNWSYTRPETSPSKWFSLGYKSAAGMMQSPIDITTSELEFCRQLKSINLMKNPFVDLKDTKYTVKNDGSTLKILFPADIWYVSFVGDKQKQYEAVEIHFHWGLDDTVGSEHKMNGNSYAAEAHLVTFNRLIYQDLEQAKVSPGGLAVLGFWLMINDEVPEDQTMIGQMGNFSAYAPTVKKPETQTSINAFDLSAVMRLIKSDKYYRYAGSMTTPPCTENVMWTMFQKPALINSRQLSLLRQLQYPPSETAAQMGDNFRPTVKLNTANSLLPRTVCRSSGVLVGFSLAAIFCSLLFYLLQTFIF
ncbi:unnamed protein product [Calicophoron daubneyi]|uniref:Carbonic anhydrase n=1 Tax=Calicophoron daubneyi TaxID=300641 RepID=A0AAV2SYT8_CALDB